MLATAFMNNVAYTSLVQKAFHDYKLIEIINEYEIKEHFSFIHPFYGVGKYQRIYISENMDYMLERLINQKVLLYQRIPGALNNVCKWKLAKRLTKFPMDLAGLTYMNYIFSPDLMYYLDYDHNEANFVIKETLS